MHPSTIKPCLIFIYFFANIRWVQLLLESIISENWLDLITFHFKNGWHEKLIFWRIHCETDCITMLRWRHLLFMILYCRMFSIPLLRLHISLQNEQSLHLDIACRHFSNVNNFWSLRKIWGRHIFHISECCIMNIIEDVRKHNNQCT